MTTENWINVAMIIAVIMTAAATLLGPIFGSYVQVRLSQPKPIPDANAPTTPEPSLVRRVLKSSAARYIATALDFLGFAVFIWLFVRLPLSKLTIGLFVYGCVSFAMQLTSIALLRLQREVYDLRLLTYQHNAFLMPSPSQPPRN